MAALWLALPQPHASFPFGAAGQLSASGAPGWAGPALQESTLPRKQSLHVLPNVGGTDNSVLSTYHAVWVLHNARPSVIPVTKKMSRWHCSRHLLINMGLQATVISENHKTSGPFPSQDTRSSPAGVSRSPGGWGLARCQWSGRRVNLGTSQTTA